MNSTLQVLWRGPLDSCNYGCGYCPFAKRAPRRETLDADRAALERFTAWALNYRHGRLGILFTPWGEALVHAWYREALAALSHAPHIERVAIQTNGSSAPGWTDAAHHDRLALWITWHPSEIALNRFLEAIQGFHRRGVRFSIGCVAVPAHLDAIAELRARLPTGTTLWINAQRPGGRYTPDQVRFLSAIDPTFPTDLKAHPSRGRACATGETAIAVDGTGNIRRCHFVAEVIGNLYSDDLVDILRPRLCPRARCDCFIGYAHLAPLGLRALYGDGLLERIPQTEAFATVGEFA